MNARQPLVPLLLAALASLAGCGGTHQKVMDEKEASVVKAEGERPEDETPAAQEPHGKVPGGPGDERRAAAVRFREPKDPRAVDPRERPALPAQVDLAVAAVKDGLLAAPGELVLALDAELAYDDEVDAVTEAGSDPDPPEVDLAGLARIAKVAGRELLLVDVRPSRRQGAKRDGYLLHAASGALLAWWSVAGEPAPATTGEEPDLPARIVAAHSRLGE